ncbi:MAG TPA: RNA methyltransferase [Polyangiaceae bacterium]|nr:RNA methyltransferase [Polyangiaceae bacterium]
MLTLPVLEASRFVLVRPHYPENVGAAARAVKTMGGTHLALVKPGRLAVPEHEMALKMAVKSWDVLEGALRFSSLAEALDGIDVAFATTSRRGVSGVLTARDAANRAVLEASQGRRLAFVFGNEKTGLSAEDVALCGPSVRIPMAADQPSINLAQAVQVVAYELFVAGLALRNREG